MARRLDGPASGLSWPSKALRYCREAIGVCSMHTHQGRSLQRRAKRQGLHHGR